MKCPTLVFDVNETLLDLRSLDAPFAAAFGTANARSDWFKQLLQLSLLATVFDDYADFTELGRRALTMVSEARECPVRDEDAERIAAALRELSPHADVVPALTALRDAGFRIAAFSNSAPVTLRVQMKHAGLTNAFDLLLSVDAVRAYKPAPVAYRYAAQMLDVAIGDIMLVAAHGWDVTGAMRAGGRAAFVARPGQVLLPHAPVPEIVGPNLADVAAQILRTCSSGT